MDNPPSVTGKLICSSAERNKYAIHMILKQYIATEGAKEQVNVLEIASGTGQHIVYFAEKFPEVIFQPSEVDDAMIRSINVYIGESGLTNVRHPMKIDILTPYSSWESGAVAENSFSFILNINMVHISKLECTENLFKNAQKVLKLGGMLFLYGPFSFYGVIAPESNLRFNEKLIEMDPEYGLRDVEDLKECGSKYGLELIAEHSLPANNHVLVWKKVQ